MRIGSTQVDTNIQSTQLATKTTVSNQAQEESLTVGKSIENQTGAKNDQNQESTTKEKLKEAVDAINEFVHLDRKASKFVLHEGLNKYYVRLIDEETDEVIKEIPPERILNAFYEMQKLAGMIVDEKI